VCHRTKLNGNWSSLAEIYGDFSTCDNGDRPPFWICCVRVWATHEAHVVTVIVVQNLVGIDAVVSKKMQLLIFNEFGLKIPVQVTEIVLRVFNP